jgi:hypothetical protein
VGEDAIGPAGAGQGVEVRETGEDLGELGVAALGAFSALLEATHASTRPHLPGCWPSTHVLWACSLWWSI